ncbi:MAG: Trk system potassium transporter TrkA [Clostridia bacterium]|nr:Trk system potassium transporter TrkA [Clostridia bacterium]
MNVTIVGGGKVGSFLAAQLVKEKHAVTVIDKDECITQKISNTCDVMCCTGNGASFAVLESVNVGECDLLFAVTGSDEVNLLSCLSAHRLGAKHTIARVRNPEYAGELYGLTKDLGLSMVVNPERETAEEIARILRFPSASRVELFAHGKAELVSFRLGLDNPLCGKALHTLNRDLGISVLICAVDRGGRLTIPRGDFVLTEGDILYLTGSPKNIELAFRKTGLSVHPAQRVIISGGGKISYYLADILTKRNMQVKIIEKDGEIATELAEQLKDATVIHGDAADCDVMAEENVGKADAFVALTGLDEGNILTSLYAKQLGVQKVIAKVNDTSMSDVITGLGIETLISPKTVVINEIIRYVRALDESGSNENIQTLYKIAEGKGEVLEFAVEEPIPGLTDIPLSQLKIRKNMLVAIIIRDRQTVIPAGSDRILPGDTFLLVAPGGAVSGLSDILEE